MKKYFIAAFVILSGLNGLATAQNTGEGKPSPQWWLNSSLADSVDQYLFHIEGQYNFTKMTGAIDGEIQSGNINVVVRKDILTHHTEYIIDRMDLKLQSLGINYVADSYAFTDYLDVDFTKLFYAEAGFIWERDNTLYINNRYSAYLGAGVNGLIARKHYLKLLAAFGNVNQQYSIPVDNFDVEKGAYTAFYVRQIYKFVIDPRFSFMEQAYYLNNTSHGDRYRMSMNLSLMIGIVQPVSLVLGYSYKFDKESELLGIIATNTTQSIGVNISL